VARAQKLKLLIANDAVLAARVGADGIHLSEASVRHAAHWRALHPRWIITAAAHGLRGTHVAALDAVFLSPAFATQSHPGTPPLGATRLRFLAMQSRPAVYALGGVDAGAARRLAGAGLAGLAATGALAV
jgi:thiamine-phosphate pyrophosphorylase